MCANSLDLHTLCTSKFKQSNVVLRETSAFPHHSTSIAHIALDLFLRIYDVFLPNDRPEAAADRGLYPRQGLAQRGLASLFIR